MLLVFCCVFTVQYHHQHHDEPEVEMTSGKMMIKKAVHCKICEHFIHHKHNLINVGVATFDFEILPVPVLQGGVHFLGDYSGIVQHFSNKGPPALA